MTEGAAAASLSPEAAAALTSHALPPLCVFLLLSMASYAVIYSATLRAVLTPGDRAFASLRLSMVEARQFVLALGVFGLAFGYVFVLSLVLGPLAALTPVPAQGALTSLLWGGGVFGLLYGAVRLSLAPAMTFAEGRVRLFSSLALTRGAFNPLMGAYAIALVLTVVVGALVLVILLLAALAVATALGGAGGVKGVMDFLQPARSAAPVPVTAAELLRPGEIVNAAASAILFTLAYVILSAPGAAIYRAVAGAAPRGLTAEDGRPWA
jgi:hypothetical protein